MPKINQEEYIELPVNYQTLPAVEVKQESKYEITPLTAIIIDPRDNNRADEVKALKHPLLSEQEQKITKSTNSESKSYHTLKLIPSNAELELIDTTAILRAKHKRQRQILWAMRTIVLGGLGVALYFSARSVARFNANVNIADANQLANQANQTLKHTLINDFIDGKMNNTFRDFFKTHCTTAFQDSIEKMIWHDTCPGYNPKDYMPVNLSNTTSDAYKPCSTIAQEFCKVVALPTLSTDRPDISSLIGLGVAILVVGLTLLVEILYQLFPEIKIFERESLSQMFFRPIEKRILASTLDANVYSVAETNNIAVIKDNLGSTLKNFEKKDTYLQREAVILAANRKENDSSLHQVMSIDSIKNNIFAMASLQFPDEDKQQRRQQSLAFLAGSRNNDEEPLGKFFAELRKKEVKNSHYSYPIYKDSEGTLETIFEFAACTTKKRFSPTI